MDFIIDPNVAYLFVMGSVLLVMLSIATPGTGLMELAALFCMVLAGYAVYNLSFNWWALLLLALSIIPFVYALQKPKRELYLVLSILLLVVGSIFMFPRTPNGSTVNPLVAILASILVAGFLWFAVRKSVEAASAKPLHNLDRVVGQTGEARTRVEAEGSVQVSGELWSAKSEKPIPAGSMIRVLGRDGFVLVVEKKG
jgi:membrane-bound serine protease (ClpP class)